MMIIRPVEDNDIDRLYQLVNMTTLHFSFSFCTTEAELIYLT
jgi:arginine/ornithine N-succinyltransferase beta subunit